jgi:nitrate reductase gamma subunit
MPTPWELGLVVTGVLLVLALAALWLRRAFRAADDTKRVSDPWLKRQAEEEAKQ